LFQVMLYYSSTKLHQDHHGHLVVYWEWNLILRMVMYVEWFWRQNLQFLNVQWTKSYYWKPHLEHWSCYYLNSLYNCSIINFIKMFYTKHFGAGMLIPNRNHYRYTHD
jgi:hypothetical protein